MFLWKKEGDLRKNIFRLEIRKNRIRFVLVKAWMGAFLGLRVVDGMGGKRASI